MNLLFCSVGRRGELIKNFKEALDSNSRIIAADNSVTAPALYLADEQYILPKVNDSKYIPAIIDICKKEKINVIATFLDPEIEILAENREIFEQMGIEVLVPNLTTAKVCFDKYNMFEFLKQHNIKTVNTYRNMESFTKAYDKGKCTFPVFVKPRTGSASVGAVKVESYIELQYLCSTDSSLIIQEFMDGADLDVDVYIDTISKKPVSMFAKKKLETKIGGANKTISFKDEKLFELIKEIVSRFEFNGPIDLDFFNIKGEYILSEINPRLGGAYLHAYGCGVDFIRLIANNYNGVENKEHIGDYEEDVLMMMYDSVVFKKKSDLPQSMEYAFDNTSYSRII